MTIKHRTDFSIDDINGRLPGRLPGLLGIECTAVRDGEMDGRMEIHPHHLAPNGYLHAASIVALADTIAGIATWAHMPDGANGFTTVELKSNHLGTARKGTLTCTAVARHVGRSTQVWDAEVVHNGKTIALFRNTQMILWPR